MMRTAIMQKGQSGKQRHHYSGRSHHLRASCKVEKGGKTMAENKAQDYFEEDKEGHVDTREKNFECEKPDKSLGCDMGIDVQG